MVAGTASSSFDSSAGEAHALLRRQFGPYTLFEPIGRGGMAELFLARTETELGATRLAVVKVILQAFADDPRFADMLIYEAKLAARLSHRHIVQVLDLGREGERLYIAMEYVEGFDLNALVRRCGKRGVALPPEHALGIVVDVLEGLDYAHRQKRDDGSPLALVHRDVSPSNVLISFEGEVKLCDFGIAHANDLVNEDQNDALKGKAGYMSPEHARAESLDARSDVFATGIILWELLAGKRLYTPRGEVPLLEQARCAAIPPLPEREDFLLPNRAELDRILARALAPVREERYASAHAFQRDLEGYLAGAGMLASRLKLGEWIASTFGTTVIDERRASERRLPKSSVPPPRSSGSVRLRSDSVPSVRVPPAPRLPRELSTPLPLTALAPLSAPALDFEAETTDPLAPLSASLACAPESLGGAAMDVDPSSSRAVLETPRKDADESERALVRSAPNEAELLAWARKRGVVSFLFFFLLAVAIVVVWALTR